MSTTAFDDQFAPDPDAPVSVEPSRVAHVEGGTKRLVEQWRAFTKESPSTIQGGIRGRIVSEEQLAHIADFLEKIDRAGRS
jgi:hypothetical protein